jgi:ATP-dependent RNA helicase DDX47/RRP3
VHLVFLLNDLAQNSIIVFTRTVHDAQRLSLLLRALGMAAIPLHGQLSQSARLGALNKFRSGGRNILVAADVASRGLDISLVDVVINFDIPQHSKDYVHRVGRTARAGRSGKSITIVTQYDVALLQRIEEMIGKQLKKFEVRKDEVALLMERVSEAQRVAIKELKEAKSTDTRATSKRQRESKRDTMDRDDDSHEAGMPSKKKYKGRR